jgi:hypothetical protein
MDGDLALVVVDVIFVVAFSVAVGAWAPRWPEAWLGHDTFPLARWPWETPGFYRRIGVARLARRLPELGGAFGGESKSALPGRDRASLTSYLREVRRAEWVHWLSIAGSGLLFLFNPWWLALAFVVAVALGNIPFITVLRNNRFRIQRIVDREARRP